MKQLSPAERMAAELQRIIKEAQQALAEFHAATSKQKRQRKIKLIDPRTKKAFK